ncbi:MAG: hypothetical protein KatS3mg008_1848 [Acidimicrobiales bacterium]|nr:MAG: hypothetical protein KatS3mg008_1848 [Acidimicrobiales bacterium]
MQTRSVRYGEVFADVYDDWYPSDEQTRACSTEVARLASGGLVLELGAGTGRIATELASRGVSTVALDISHAMLRRCPRPDPFLLPVLADMASLPFRPESFSVVFCACNTFLSLDRGDLQLSCLRECARVVTPDGVVLIETFLPRTPAASERVAVSATRWEEDRCVTMFSIVTGETVVGGHVEHSPDGTRVRPWKIRPVTPDALDAMALTAGLEPVRRSFGWHPHQDPSESATVISCYRPNRCRDD